MTIAYYFDWHKRFSVEGIKDFISGMGRGAFFTYLIFYMFTTIILFPTALLSTASGIIWGPYLGTFYTIIVATISAVAPFLIARFLGRKVARKMIKNTKIEICDRFLSTNGFFSVLIMRLIPIFPWNMVNYGSGLCGIRLRDYLLATFLGIIPGSFAYNLIGDSLGQPINKIRVALIFGIIALMAITAFVYKKYRGSKKK